MTHHVGDDAGETANPAASRLPAGNPPGDSGTRATGWAALDWPDLSREFPPPAPRTPSPPPLPDVPADVGERVRRAEVTRGIVVPLCALAGALLVCAGSVLVVRLPSPAGSGRPPALALLLIFTGLGAAFPLPALATLLVIGPTWRQRQQHYALLRWRAERRAWRDRERARYLAALAPADRERLQRALAAASPPSPADGDVPPPA